MPRLCVWAWALLSLQAFWLAHAQPTPDQLQAAINAAIANHQPYYAIPGGTYAFGKRNLLVVNATDFVLDAPGAVREYPSRRLHNRRGT
jgi:hypothetical protein